MVEKQMDLRVRRTLSSIQKAFYELVQEKGLTNISITDLTKTAGINRKTFYLHYNSMEDLLDVVKEECANRVLEVLGESMKHQRTDEAISKFFHYLYECTGIQRLLLCEPENKDFYKAVMEVVLNSDTFQDFYKKTPYPNLTEAYVTSISSIYWEWDQSGQTIPLDDLIAYTAELVSGGYKSVLK